MLNFLLSAFSLSALSDNPTALTITIIMAVLIVLLIIMDIVDRSKTKKAAAEKKSNAVESKTENTDKSSVINEDAKPQPVVDVVPDAKPEPKFVESVTAEKVEGKDEKVENEKAENKAIQFENAEVEKVDIKADAEVNIEKVDTKADAEQNIEKIELKPETENENKEKEVLIKSDDKLETEKDTDSAKTEDEIPEKGNIVKAEKEISKPVTKQKSQIKIAKGKDDGFHFYLYDENGDVIFESKRYASPATSKRGINAFKRNVTELNYKIEKEKKDFYFIIRKGNTIYKGLNFKSSNMAEENAKKVKELAFNAKIVE